jgi:hypothetical protein
VPENSSEAATSSSASRRWRAPGGGDRTETGYLAHRQALLRGGCGDAADVGQARSGPTRPMAAPTTKGHRKIEYIDQWSFTNDTYTE